jgi:hypothetical protein
MSDENSVPGQLTLLSDILKTLRHRTAFELKLHKYVQLKKEKDLIDTGFGPEDTAPDHLQRFYQDVRS